MTSNLPTVSLDSQQITRERLEWIFDCGKSTVSELLSDSKPRIHVFRYKGLVRASPESVLQFILSNTRIAKNLSGDAAARTAALMQDPIIWQRIERLIADQTEAKVRAALATMQGDAVQRVEKALSHRRAA
jgi:hypothetical protein